MTPRPVPAAGARGRREPGLSALCIGCEQAVSLHRSLWCRACDPDTAAADAETLDLFGEDQ